MDFIFIKTSMLLLLVVQIIAWELDPDPYERRFDGIKVTLLKKQRECFGKKTIEDDKLLIDYQVLNDNKSMIGYGNMSLQIGNNPDTRRAEFLDRGNALINMCVGDVRSFEVPIGLCPKYGGELLIVLSKETIKELDFNDVNGTLEFIVTLKDIIPADEIEEVDETIGEYIESLWEEYGGRNITKLNEIPQCTRRTKNGDKVRVDYLIRVLGQKYTHVKRGFAVTIDEEVEYENNCYNMEFFCRGGFLLDMCIGEVREITVPMRIAVGFGERLIIDFKWLHFDLDIKDYMSFTVTLREIINDDYKHDDEL